MSSPCTSAVPPLTPIKSVYPPVLYHALRVVFYLHDVTIGLARETYLQLPSTFNMGHNAKIGAYK